MTKRDTFFVVAGFFLQFACVLLFSGVFILTPRAAEVAQQVNVLYGCDFSDLPQSFGCRLDREPPYPPPVTATATITPTVAPTETPVIPTATPTELPTMPPVSHDLNDCHHPDAAQEIYHDHGTCWWELPDDTPIKAWVEARPAWQGVGLQPHSSPIENLYPDGKHVGYFRYFQRFEECFKFDNQGLHTADFCVRDVYATVHSMRTAQALRTPGGEHSGNVIAVVCPEEDFPASCEGGDRIVAARGVLHYGEPHASYKNTYCRFDDAIEYTQSDNHVSQPPYWAQNVSRDLETGVHVEFNSTLRNNKIASEIGFVNNLFQWTFSDTVWSIADPFDELSCGDPANDIQVFTSTNDGFKMQTVLWTLVLKLSEYPRPFEGFTDRIGSPSGSCVEANFDCAPLYIGADVPLGDGFLNFPVENAKFRAGTLPEWQVIDLTQPDTYAPGFGP